MDILKEKLKTSCSLVLNGFFLMVAIATQGCYYQPASINAAAVNQKQGNAKQNTNPTKKTHTSLIADKNKKDGAPPGALPIVFQRVKPVYEPLSRYGNPESYEVGGRTYSILRTASGYKTHGIASWYGTKFHNQRTSSGEGYDMYAMTAAHKTLPLPTYVRVKNLGNGREAIVKVNDRGPFHSDRIIDLSYAAATKLGLLPKGTAPVEIEALIIPGKSAIAHYYVQAGAFKSSDLAKLFQKKLAQFTPSPVIIETYNEHYTVKVGPFADKKMTELFQGQLKAHGISGSFTMLQ